MKRQFDGATPTRTSRVSRKEIARLDALAGLLDDRFRIPGTGLRFGLDGVVGLLPGIGDAVTGAISAYLVVRAWQVGAPFHIVLRMVGNVGCDMVLGAIPLVGDLFDFGFKANRRNVNMLLRHLRETSP